MPGISESETQSSSEIEKQLDPMLLGVLPPVSEEPLRSGEVVDKISQNSMKPKRKKRLVAKTTSILIRHDDPTVKRKKKKALRGAVSFCQNVKVRAIDIEKATPEERRRAERDKRMAIEREYRRMGDFSLFEKA